MQLFTHIYQLKLIPPTGKERNKAMSKWIDFSLDERKAMIQGVVESRQIDEAAAEKDWWVTAVLYALLSCPPIPTGGLSAGQILCLRS